jgi:hypothetical protein
MKDSSTFEAHMRILVRFQESFEERVFRLTGSPRGNVCLGTRQMKATPLVYGRMKMHWSGLMTMVARRYGIFGMTKRMLQNAPIHLLAISQDKLDCGCKDCGKGA